MDKCNFSEEGVRWNASHFSTKSRTKESGPAKCVISGKEIIHDLRSGMTRWEIMEKYGVSGEQLKKALEIILQEKRKIAEKIAGDVRSGMNGSELMEKYQLSNSALQKVCQTLLTEGLLVSGDIKGLRPSLDNGASVHHERRKFPGDLRRCES